VLRSILLSIVVLLSMGAPSRAQAQRDGWILYTVLDFSKKAPSLEWISAAVARVDGSGQKSLPLGPGAVDPSFRPDGKRIIFSRLDSDNRTSSLWSADADGTHLTHLRDLDGIGLSPSRSPDGKWIAWFEVRAGQKPDIACFVAESDGVGARPLTSETAYGPRWSHDGRHLAYVKFNDHEHRSWLVVADGDGTNPTVIRESSKMIHSLSFSPDDRRLAFIEADPNGPGLRGEIRTVGVDGQEERAVTATATWLGLEYADDGRTLYTTRLDMKTSGGRLVAIPAGGGAEKLVIEGKAKQIPSTSGGFVYLLLVPEREKTSTPTPPPIQEAKPAEVGPARH
jgi:dipeptidyl aminopeptidase/acylaminoacyl peptidase